MATTHFRLVPDTISPNTVKALEQLTREARQGKIIGIAFCAMYKQQEFIANAAGEARRNPVLTRGMIASLDDALARQSDQPL